LTELVQLLDDQALIPRLRLGSIEPNELTEQLLALFCSSSRLCHHLHIPLQSGSDSVLKRMGRHYDSSLYRTRIEQAHRLLPDAFIAADLIAGFPGETEQEFLETCQLIESLPLADLHVFPYSRRPGTAAATMQGHLQPGVIKERAEQLRTTAAAKRRAFQQQCINNPLQVLGQHYNQQTGLMNGLSRNYLEVCYPATPLLLNQEVVVQVDKLKDGRLLGRCTPPRSY
jgi:threonylcarbamoyladenosine tRNA methylthiotransferase MtaB